MIYRFGLLLCLLAVSTAITAQSAITRPRVAVLDFAEPAGDLTASELLALNLKSAELSVLDRGLVRAAANGIGYQRSLNLSLQEARDLGAALGCDFYILGDAQTVRRSPSSGEPYFEAYASLFVVSSRTGKLLLWQRPSFQAPTPLAAQKLLSMKLSGAELRHQVLISLRRAQEDELQLREISPAAKEPVIEEAPDDESAAAEEGLRLPRAFRRLRPKYTDEAARADVEATVDVLVDIDAKGEVAQAEIARWGGFGLDQSTLETVRQLHFFPALRNGTAIPMRVLLRYNFRKTANATN